MMLEQALVMAAAQDAGVPGAAADTAAEREPEGAAAPVVRGTVTVGADDPFLAGHYPGFPLVPGFSLVGYVHDLVAGAVPGRAHRPVVVEKARFLSPVRPGEEVVVEAHITRDGDGVRAGATVSADARPAAEIRLHYPQAEPQAETQTEPQTHRTQEST
ncbi:3-hydroxyacyl-ACP dehydratase FabZ family protein [Streptomyces sp. NPDC056367]|uniref:3-hydroxyacyl-ACP dehydratase FabZ family protein n=1 Tax=Streptomyces sp. NPDC056367 TaxID=3345797 RepID=UPI0035E16887